MRPGACVGYVRAARTSLPRWVRTGRTYRTRRAACPQGPTHCTYWVRVPALGVRYVQRTVAPQVTIRDRADIVCLVRRTYGNLFDYEIDDAGTSGHGHAEPACPNVDMGNPGSSYRR